MNSIRLGAILTWLMVFPVILLLTVIPWELVLAAGLLSDWMYDGRSRLLGGVFNFVFWAGAVLLTLFTVAAFVQCLGQSVRVIRGSPPRR